MMQIKDDEYVITPKHSESKHYKVLYKGEEITDVIAIVRRVI